MSEKREKLLIPLIAIALGLILGVIILLISGQNVSSLFSCLWQCITGMDLSTPGSSINLRYPAETLMYAMPIILTGLAFGFASRTGMFNIGAEGQIIAGSLASVSVALLVPMPPVVGTIVCLLAGGIAGALWAFIPGILKAKKNISEVVTGIMLNYTALYGANYFLKLLPGSSQTSTAAIPESASLNSAFFKSITNNSRFHWGFIVVIIALIAYWFILEKTSFGYSLRATGFNKEGARYAGIKVTKSTVISIMISGFLAGIAGAIVVQGMFNKGRMLTAADNYGFDGIAVGLVGGCTAIGTLFSGLLFGLLNFVQPLLQTNNIPQEIGKIISASIVFFVAMQYAIKYYLEKIVSKRKQNSKTETAVKGGASK